MRFWIVLVPLLLHAAILQVGDRIMPRQIADQFENVHEIGHETYWVITWDRATTRTANGFFREYPGLQSQKRVALLVDVSQTPSGILSLFVLPRMQGYKHTILLSYDEVFNRSLPYQEGMVTVITFDEGKVKSIAYAEDETALEALLK